MVASTGGNVSFPKRNGSIGLGEYIESYVHHAVPGLICISLVMMQLFGKVVSLAESRGA